MKKNPIIYLIAVAFILSATAMACPEKSKGADIAWRNIPLNVGDVEESGRTVIRTEQEWNTWLAKHKQNGLRKEAREAHKVDFDKVTILIASMGMRNTGGFSISFKEIKKVDDILKVVVKSTSPCPDSIVTQAITYPIAIVSVPKHEGKVEFIEE